MIKALLLTLILLMPSSAMAQHPVQAYFNYPYPGYYVLKNHHYGIAFQCWVRFPDGYTIRFPLYPQVVSNPFPVFTTFGCN